MSNSKNELTQPADDMNGPKSAVRRFRFQFNLRTLLIATALIATNLALPSYWWHQISRDGFLVDQIHLKGGKVRAVDQQPCEFASLPGSFPPRWFCNSVGSPNFHQGKIVVLSCFSSSFSKTDLTYAWQLQRVQGLSINLDDVTPDELRDLRNLDDLELLELSRCILDRDTVRAIAELPHLRELWLTDCNVPLDAWGALDQMAKLSVLHLDGSSITDDGLLKIGCCDRLNTFSLKATRVSLSGLRSLRRFPALREVTVPDFVDSDGSKFQFSDKQLHDLNIDGRIEFKEYESGYHPYY